MNSRMSVDYSKIDSKNKEYRLRFESHIKPMILEFTNKTGITFKMDKRDYYLMVRDDDFHYVDKTEPLNNAYYNHNSRTIYDNSKDYVAICRIYCKLENDIREYISKEVDKLLE